MVKLQGWCCGGVGARVGGEERGGWRLGLIDVSATSDDHLRAWRKAGK